MMNFAASSVRTPAVRLAAMVAVLVMCIAGCAARLPAHEPKSGAESIRLMADRAAGVSTLQSAATVELRMPDAGTIVLDSALTAALPDKMRIRAWKFDRAVLDATVLPGEFWLYQPESTDAARPPLPAGELAGGLRIALAVLGADFYRGAELEEMTGKAILIRGDIEGRIVRCMVDRRTLTARTFESAGEGRGTRLTLDDYAMVDGVPWPRRITIEGGEGRVVIRLRDPELNGVVAPEAFVPPRRAVRMP